MKNKLPKRLGFTMMEVIITVSILGLIISIGGPYLYGARLKAILRGETDRLAGVLQHARQQSMGAYKSQEYYVLIGSTFPTSSYTSFPENKVYQLPSGILIMSSSMNHYAFSKISGHLDPPMPSGSSQTIELRSGNFFTHVSVNNIGTISTTLPQKI